MPWAERTAALLCSSFWGRRLPAAGWPPCLSAVSSASAKPPVPIRASRRLRPVEARLLVRLADAERGAVEAARSKSEFIAHMSHELRTPLNAVIGFSEVIAGGLFGPAGHPKYAEYAHDIADAGRGLHAKIGDILEFANIEAGRYPLKLAPVELSDLAAVVVDEHRGRAFSRRIGSIWALPNRRWCAPTPSRCAGR